jgi:hypothetical protein
LLYVGPTAMLQPHELEKTSLAAHWALVQHGGYAMFLENEAFGDSVLDEANIVWINRNTGTRPRKSKTEGDFISHPFVFKAK